MVDRIEILHLQRGDAGRLISQPAGIPIRFICLTGIFPVFEALSYLSGSKSP